METEPVFAMGCPEPDGRAYCEECGAPFEWPDDLSRLWDAVALWVALESLDGWSRERLLVVPAHTVAYR